VPASSAPRYEYRRPVDLPGVEILRVDNGWGLGPIYHSTFALCSAVHRIGPQPWLQAARAANAVGEPSLIWPGEVQQLPRLDWPCDYRLLRIEPCVVADLARARRAARHPTGAAPNDSSLGAALEAFVRAEDEVATLPRRRGRLRTLARELVAHVRAEGTHAQCSLLRHALHRARRKIVEQWNSELDLCTLARDVGLSPSRFMHAFTREFGLPPHRFQLAVRVEQVRRLLANGTRAAEIDAGFVDQSHLIHCFKRTLGVTPGEYQRMIHADKATRTRGPGCASGLLAR
jgi:AraC-like DNA-binding protein